MSEDKKEKASGKMSSRKILLLIALAGMIIGIDQATKLYIHTQFQLSDTMAVVDGFFNITYVRNYGAAFGFMTDAPETFRKMFFIIMPPLALLFVLMILRTVEDDDTIQILSLAAIFGGAIGNYIDRLRFGYVVDFLDVHIKNKHSWPAFNVADIAIVCGVSVLIYLIVTEKTPEKT